MLYSRYNRQNLKLSKYRQRENSLIRMTNIALRWNISFFDFVFLQTNRKQSLVRTKTKFHNNMRPLRKCLTIHSDYARNKLITLTVVTKAKSGLNFPLGSGLKFLATPLT